MSASTTVVSTRSLRQRRTLSAAASLPSRAVLTAVMVSGPQRRTSLLAADGPIRGAEAGGNRRLSGADGDLRRLAVAKLCDPVGLGVDGGPGLRCQRHERLHGHGQSLARPP